MQRKYFFLHIFSQLIRKDISYIKKNILKNYDSLCDDLSLQNFLKEVSLSSCAHMNLKWQSSCFNSSFQDAYRKNMKFMSIKNIDFISYENSFYPRILKYIDSYPTGLFVKGNKNLLIKNCISIVGSRKAPSESIQASYEIASMLSECGYVIVSGGAYGCDIAAHKGALESLSEGASTIVVLPGGLDKIYPKGNASVFVQTIQKGGLVVTERIVGQQIYPFDFPVRNRIISGFSKKLIVMAAGDKSGAMLTVRNALDQGRDVLVYDSSSSLYQKGIVSLKEDGAFIFKNYNELIDGLKL